MNPDSSPAMKTIVTVAVLLLTACTNHGKVRDRELGRIAEWLPGEYHGADSHLVILPIAAPFVGDQVLYVERIDSTNQVVAQNLYRFEKSVDEKAILQRIFAFKEPQRWQRGYQRPEIFMSMLAQDVTATPACDLLWTFGEKTFSAGTSMKACRVQRLEFDGDALKLVERGGAESVVLSFHRVVVE